MTESKQTTLTREQLLNKIPQPRYEEVDVDGLGTVGIRQRTRLQESRRTYAMFDSRGKVDKEMAALEPFFRLVDQVMVDESTPMFKDSDVHILASSPVGELDGLFDAVARFNSEVEVADNQKKSEGSTESSES